MSTPRSSLDPARLTALLEETGALRRGHFRLSSGLHSAAYVQCALLLERPRIAHRVGRALAALLDPHRPESILSPALGGIVIGYATAAELGVPFRFCERSEGAMRLRRGFALTAGERIAVVEDVVTTGGSAGEAVALAARAGARTVAVGVIIDRGAATGSTFPAPFESLLRLELEAFDPGDCPLCRGGEPVERPGSR